MKDLKGVDLKLLLSLEALVEEGSVSNAAKRVGLSQPAMSASLARLRTLMDDPILIRTGRHSTPTSRAMEALTSLRPALKSINEIFDNNQSFKPNRSEALVRIAATDYGMSIVMPPLLRLLSLDAPNIRIVVKPILNQSPLSTLHDHTNDLTIGAIAPASKAVETKQLFTEHLVALVANNHPLSRKEKLSAGELASYPLLVGSFEQGETTILDTMFRQNRTLNPPLHRVASFTALPHLIADSHFIAIAPEKLADKAVAQHGHKKLGLRLKTPKLPIHLSWHTRSNSNPVLQWIIDSIVGAWS